MLRDEPKNEFALTSRVTGVNELGNVFTLDKLLLDL